MNPYDDVYQDAEPEWKSPAAERLDTLLEGLTDPQRESVLHRGTPLVILAGAGTGKTTALTRRIAHIIASGDARPDEILAVTFTNKAARELEKRIKKLLDDDLYGLTVGTFHSVCARMLRDNHALFGIDQDFVIMDADDQKRMIRRLIKGAFIKLEKEEAKAIAEEVYELIEKVREDSENGHNVLMQASSDASYIYNMYETTKQKDGVLDFTDLLHIVTLGFRSGDVDPQLLAGNWKHILVDEYQDTNGLQFEWLKYITGSKPDLAVVGDDDQVLYSWRGAKIENILNFHEQFKNTKIIRLEQNFRSTGYILDAANGLIEKNKKRLGKTLFTTDEKGQPIHVRYFVNAEMEAQWVANEIKAAIADGMEATDIAILSRSSPALNLIEHKLTYAGIPYVLSGGKRFQDKAEIRDAMAYLRLASNPNDSSSFERVVNTPKRGMGDMAVKRIIDASDVTRKEHLPLSLMDIAENYALSKSLPGDVPGKLLSFVKAIKAANTLFWRGGTAAEVMNLVLEESGYNEAMKALLEDMKSSGDNSTVESLQNRMHNLADLIKLGNDLTPIQLIEQLGLSEDGRSKNSKGVWVGTIHAAKGLEWPMVIGIAWEDNILPSWQSLLEKGDMLAEERRCAYVEITRARKYLTLTTTGERFQKPAERSRFLSELPQGSFTQFDMQPE